MRWKTKPTPKLGDTRWVKKFAWFPVETDSKETVWLESYYVKEQYVEKPFGNAVAGYSWYKWARRSTVTPEQYDKQLQEQILTAITTSGNFTPNKTTNETNP